MSKISIAINFKDSFQPSDLPTFFLDPVEPLIESLKTREFWTMYYCWHRDHLNSVPLFDFKGHAGYGINGNLSFGEIYATSCPVLRTYISNR